MKRIKWTIDDTRREVRRQTTKVRGMAKLCGLRLFKAKNGFSFGYELRDEDNRQVFGDAAKGFCRTLEQCERFLGEYALKKLTAPPVKDDAALGLTADSRPKVS